LIGKTWVLVLVAALASVAAEAQSCTAAQRDAWFSKALKDVQSIRVGMTRGDLLKVFTVPGGFSGPRKLRGTYAYKGSPYIKVDVEFSPAAAPDTNGRESPSDVIKAISRPYLAGPAYD
jgi:hypothetical protein